MTFRGCNLRVTSVKLYFSKNLLLYPRARSDKLSISNEEETTKIVNSITPGKEILVLGRGHKSPIVKMHYFFNNLLDSGA